METTTLLFVMVAAGAVFLAGWCWLHLGGGANNSWLHRYIGHLVTRQLASPHHSSKSVPSRFQLYMEAWKYVLIKIVSLLLISAGALVFAYMLLAHNSLLIAMPGLALFLAISWLLERILWRW